MQDQPSFPKPLKAAIGKKAQLNPKEAYPPTKTSPGRQNGTNSSHRALKEQ